MHINPEVPGSTPALVNLSLLNRKTIKHNQWQTFPDWSFGVSIQIYKLAKHLLLNQWLTAPLTFFLEINAVTKWQMVFALYQAITNWGILILTFELQGSNIKWKHKIVQLYNFVKWLLIKIVYLITISYLNLNSICSVDTNLLIMACMIF